jgi:hypothetical protein
LPYVVTATKDGVMLKEEREQWFFFLYEAMNMTLLL